MLYFAYKENGQLNEIFQDPKDEIRHRNIGHKVLCRNDIKSYEQAEQIARDATREVAVYEAGTGRGQVYLPVDNGPGVYPRFDVIEAPMTGDPVSRSFNGDSYPAGEIASVSPTYKKIVTTTGEVFYRRKQSASWKQGGTWFMVYGHRDERNPHF